MLITHTVEEREGGEREGGGVRGGGERSLEK